jgi:hypothetical protein
VVVTAGGWRVLWFLGPSVTSPMVLLNDLIERLLASAGKSEVSHT